MHSEIVCFGVHRISDNNLKIIYPVMHFVKEQHYYNNQAVASLPFRDCVA